MSFRTLVGKKQLFFDGATGTMLQAAGLKVGELPETWNLLHPEEVVKIHRAYVEAGSNILKTNTFGANALKYAGTDYTVEELIAAAVHNARRACLEANSSTPMEERLVALNLGPTGKLLAPYGDLPFEEAVSLYAEMVRAGAAAGADLVLVETMSDTYEAKAALLAAKENCDLPVVCTFTFDEEGRLLSGARVETAILMAQSMGAAAVGFNCGLGPKQLVKLLPAALETATVPLIINPNAGLPVERDGHTAFEVGPEEFAQLMLTFAKSGVAVLGGCCGTTPAHIKALIDLVTAEQGRQVMPVEAAKRAHAENLTAIAGYGSSVAFEAMPVLIGERINPTGKPRLKEALKEENLDYVCRLALEQLERGAVALDVNVGLPGIDEPALLEKALLSLQAITSVPLQLDTSSYEAMERGLRLYNGRPLLNSVNGKEESLSRVLPLAKKYGAVVVGLCLDDKGIPATAEGRLAIAEKIIARAAEYGLAPRDIVIDPLALTISTGGENAKVDLEVIRQLTAKGIKTTMGVSNISFGLPNRDAINSSFFTLAMGAGLSSAILNPQSEAMLAAYYAHGALYGLDEGCKDYVAKYAEAPKVSGALQVADYTVYQAITKGLREQCSLAVRRELEQGKEPLAVINEAIVPALDFVGQGFERKTLFLPQLLMSADAAKAGFEVIKEQLSSRAEGEAKESQAIILATVEGDIHDIGKNIVKVLWENYGYRVIDLGKDVPIEQVAAAAKQQGAKLVGLSALMTTTVDNMAKTIATLRQEAPQCKILVGGAVLTEDYAKEIGADGYAANAIAAVNYAKAVL